MNWLIKMLFNGPRTPRNTAAAGKESIQITIETDRKNAKDLRNKGVDDSIHVDGMRKEVVQVDGMRKEGIQVEDMRKEVIQVVEKYTNSSPHFEDMRKEVIQVISKYINFSPDDIQVTTYNRSSKSVLDITINLPDNEQVLPAGSAARAAEALEPALYCPSSRGLGLTCGQDAGPSQGRSSAFG